MVTVKRLSDGEIVNKNNDLDIKNFLDEDSFKILSKDLNKNINSFLVKNFPGFDNMYYKTVSSEILSIFQLEFDDKIQNLLNLINENKKLQDNMKTFKEEAAVLNPEDSCFEIQTVSINSVDYLGNPVDINDRFKLGKI
jgi:hypothetical protein